jgi:hypothetical protein
MSHSVMVKLGIDGMAFPELPTELIQRIFYDVPVFDLIELSHHFSLFRCHCDDPRFWRARAKYRYHDTRYMDDATEIPVVNYLNTIAYHDVDVGQLEIMEIRDTVSRCLAKLDAHETMTYPQVRRYRLQCRPTRVPQSDGPWLSKVTCSANLILDAHGRFSVFRKIHRLIIDASVTDLPRDLLDHGIRLTLHRIHGYTAQHQLTVDEFVTQIVMMYFDPSRMDCSITLTDWPDN